MPCALEREVSAALCSYFMSHQNWALQHPNVSHLRILYPNLGGMLGMQETESRDMLSGGVIEVTDSLRPSSSTGLAHGQQASETHETPMSDFIQFQTKATTCFSEFRVSMQQCSAIEGGENVVCELETHFAHFAHFSK